MKPTKENPVICWWSGGVTSAVTCKIAIDTYGAVNCRAIMIDTHNEDGDTYRFLKDCEGWFGATIESITAIGKKYDSIQDVWEEFNSLNVAKGAVCSSRLKMEVRKAFQRRNKYCAQVFGFDTSEPDRAENIKKGYPASLPIFPLLEFGLSKGDCIKMVEAAGIEIPRAYKLGFRNNNCFQTGCVQGGVGYWQKIRRDFPEKFQAMADMEHRLTDSKGSPVTCLKDQSNKARETGRFQSFLLPHPGYPDYKDLSMFKPQKVAPLTECNGFCGTATKPMF